MKCPAPVAIRADWMEEYVEREFLALAGPIPVGRTVITPGYDPAPEIAATLAEYAAHQEEKGQQKSNAAKRAWKERADALDNRLAMLEATPARPETREVTPTGRTLADEWTQADDQARRYMLIEAGARLEVRKGTRGGWRTLDERRVSFTLAGELDPAVEEYTALREELTTTDANAPQRGSRIRLVKVGDAQADVVQLAAERAEPLYGSPEPRRAGGGLRGLCHGRGAHHSAPGDAMARQLGTAPKTKEP